MKKILFGITSLDMGGAEQSLVLLANNLCNRYDVTIFEIYGGGVLETKLDRRVKLKAFYPKRKQGLMQNLKTKVVFTFSFLYRWLAPNDEFYDISIAYLEGPVSLIFNYVKSKKSIAWIHTLVSKNIQSSLRIKQLGKAYQHYDEFVFVSKITREDFNQVFGLKSHTHIIGNLIDVSRIEHLKLERQELLHDCFTFVTVSRLVEAKGLKRLLQIHIKLLETVKHRIYVIGDGPERQSLEQLIKIHHLQDTFILLGQKVNPYSYMVQADCLLLVSLYEGLGNVCIESKALNLRIIVTQTGASEALEGYPNGIIVPNNEEDIYQGMLKMIKYPIEIEHIAFSQDNVIIALEDLFND